MLVDVFVTWNMLSFSASLISRLSQRIGNQAQMRS